MEAEARSKIRRLLRAGITCFLDLTYPGESGLLPYASLMEDEAARLGIPTSYNRLPVQDMGTPSAEEMARILSLISKTLANKQRIYLHCWGGRGRTGTVVGCYLVQQGLSGEQALEQIRQMRQVTEKSALPSPETAAQRAMVLLWTPQPWIE